jgi:hypothetical protein
MVMEMTKAKTRTRLWERAQIKTSKLVDEPMVASLPITVNDLRGRDALLERLRNVHGEHESRRRDEPS